MPSLPEPHGTELSQELRKCLQLLYSRRNPREVSDKGREREVSDKERGIEREVNHKDNKREMSDKEREQVTKRIRERERYEITKCTPVFAWWYKGLEHNRCGDPSSHDKVLHVQ